MKASGSFIRYAVISDGMIPVRSRRFTNIGQSYRIATDSMPVNFPQSHFPTKEFCN